MTRCVGVGVAASAGFTEQGLPRMGSALVAVPLVMLAFGPVDAIRLGLLANGVAAITAHITGFTGTDSIDLDMD